MNLYLIGGVVALIAVLGFGFKYERTRANREEQMRITLDHQLGAEREARAHEQKIAKEASDEYQADLRRINDERLTPIPVWVRYKSAPAAVPAEGSAPSGPNAATAGHDSEEVQVDRGPALLDYAITCEANQQQLERLQQWVLAR